ncbi:hypothetical protein PIROE2DRAFT_16684 [Piromyces sp. E2]|nr:hypothetical protein PIROE2DRAFT_16684 [Piromyces sp. E2]|eukprot:OUM58123.1 hypothetical protein PIROE2DRAFT_16684 [Piromyces sp. E2]
MKGFYFYIIIGLIVNFILITVNAKNIPLDTANEKKENDSIKNNGEKTKEQYYLIYVENKSSESKKIKREESNATNKVVNSVIDEIHQLIINNVDSYEKPEILEKMEKEDSLRKRDQVSEYLLDYGDSSLVYPISTLNNVTVLYAYLSSDVVEVVKSMPHVKHCDKEIYYEPASNSTLDFIKENSHWKDVSVTNDAPLHLSVVSQGKFDKSVNSKYDNNYYYPSSAGEGVDIFIFDSGFDFTHDEFSNTDERTVKCVFEVKDGKLIKTLNEKVCNNRNLKHHGSVVSTTAAGKISGAAGKANVYGVLFDEYSAANKVAALQYIKDNLIGPNKAIFNFSHGNFIEYDPNEITDYDREYELINTLTEKGAIFFASAGNDSEYVINESKKRRYLPCTNENIICVGGVTISNSYSYINKYSIDPSSNRGRGVDIYAPFSVTVSYKDEYRIERSNKIVSGTSYSSPLVAGIVATILSDNKNINFNKESMLDYLNQIGHKNIIEGISRGDPNLFINNGNHIVYDRNGNMSWYNPVDDQKIEKIITSNEPYVWTKWNGLFPSNAISTINSDGKTLVVGRITYNNGVHCGYVDIKSKKITIYNGDDAIEFFDGFEILTIPSNHFYWKKISNLTQLNDKEDVIVVSGSKSNGNVLGVAKCEYENKEYFGEIDLNILKNANYGIGKKGITSIEYEVLIYSKKPIVPYQWKTWHGKFPSDAVYIKNNPNGKSFVVGRTTYKNGIYCGYVDIDTKKLTISLDNKELAFDKDYEILIGPNNHFAWKKINQYTKLSDNYKIIIGGNENNGNSLGVAKCKYDNNYYFGNTNLEYLDYANIGINNKVKHITDFEVLTYSEEPVIPYQWKKWNGKIPYNAIITNNPNDKSYAIGRTTYANGIHCGYIDLTSIQKKLVITYNGNKIEVLDNIEILTCPSNRMYWKNVTDVSQLEDQEHFVIGGNESNGVELGVTAITINNNLYYGEINLEELNYATVAIAYEQKAISTTDYKVLIYTEEPIESSKPLELIDP